MRLGGPDIAGALEDWHGEIAKAQDLGCWARVRPGHEPSTQVDVGQQVTRLYWTVLSGVDPLEAAVDLIDIARHPAHGAAAVLEHSHVRLVERLILDIVRDDANTLTDAGRVITDTLEAELKGDRVRRPWVYWIARRYSIGTTDACDEPFASCSRNLPDSSAVYRVAELGAIDHASIRGTLPEHCPLVGALEKLLTVKLDVEWDLGVAVVRTPEHFFEAERHGIDLVSRQYKRPYEIHLALDIGLVNVGVQHFAMIAGAAPGQAPHFGCLWHGVASLRGRVA